MKFGSIFFYLTAVRVQGLIQMLNMRRNAQDLIQCFAARESQFHKLWRNDLWTNSCRENHFLSDNTGDKCIKTVSGCVW